MPLLASGARAFAVLLLISTLGTSIVAAQSLPKEFPVNAIPIPSDSAIADHSDAGNDLQLQIEKHISGEAMVKFYRESLGKTIPRLNEAAGISEGTYWFWGEFDSGKAAFSVTVLNSDNTEPERVTTAVMIRVLLKRKNELPEYWKQSKDIMFKHVQDATQSKAAAK